MNAPDPTDLDADALSRAIHAREVSCREVMHAYLARIRRISPRFNAIVNPAPEDVLLLREMKGVWDDLLTPFGKSLTLSEISTLAALSGISEEIFFRGAVQAEIGIAGASVLFGLLHPLNLSYVIWASTVGCAFGVLYQATGSLLPSIICHGVYNFAALVYLRYWYLGESRDQLLLAR